MKKVLLKSTGEADFFEEEARSFDDELSSKIDELLATGKPGDIDDAGTLIIKANSKPEDRSQIDLLSKRDQRRREERRAGLAIQGDLKSVVEAQTTPEYRHDAETLLIAKQETRKKLEALFRAFEDKPVEKAILLLVFTEVDDDLGEAKGLADFGDTKGLAEKLGMSEQVITSAKERIRYFARHKVGRK